MRHPVVILYERQPEMAAALKEQAKAEGWLLRPARDPRGCRSLAAEADPGVLFFKIERSLVEELELVSELRQLNPHLPLVVASDVKLDSVTQRVQFAATLYDLGASYVLFPPMQGGTLGELAAGYLRSFADANGEGA